MKLDKRNSKSQGRSWVSVTSGQNLKQSHVFQVKGSHDQNARENTELCTVHKICT